MKAQVINLTPELAKEYLKNNTTNRDLNKSKVNEYTEAFRKGHWRENGESIIIDRNGRVKDGQHRLEAVIKSGLGYNAVLVTDVDPDVMHTIDIGKNRSLGDMLKLNGFKSYNTLSATIKMIVLFETNLALKGKGHKGEGYGAVTNSVGLEYANKNRQNLETLVKSAEAIYTKCRTRVLSPSKIAFYMYVLDKYRNSDNVVIFMKSIVGVNIYEENAASWLYGKLLSAKQNKIGLSSKWVLGTMIKAWNHFNSDDAPVKYIKYDVNSDLPEVIESFMPKFETV